AGREGFMSDSAFLLEVRRFRPPPRAGLLTASCPPSTTAFRRPTVPPCDFCGQYGSSCIDPRGRSRSPCILTHIVSLRHRAALSRGRLLLSSGVIVVVMSEFLPARGKGVSHFISYKRWYE